MEAWIAIPGFDERYQVSNLGRIRSLQLKGRARREPLVIRDYSAGKGYRVVFLFDGEKFHQQYVHRVVLAAFRGEPAQAGMQGAHLDGDRTHNVLDNLVWATVVENHSHKLIHGTHQRGEKAPNSKLTSDAVAEARAAYDPGRISTADLAKRYGVSQSHMSDVISGKRWGHMPGARPSRNKRGVEQCGEANHNARLSESDVLEIRAECARLRPGVKGGRTGIAERFGVSRFYVDRIARGDAWRHVATAEA